MFQGTSTTVIIKVEPDSTFSPQVTLYVESAPTGVSASLQPDYGTAPFSAMLVLNASENVAPGEYHVTIGSISKDGNESITYALTVEQRSTTNSASHSVTIVVHDIYGMPVSGAMVTLSLAGWSPSLQTGGSGTVVFASVPVGQFNATVTYMGASTVLSGNSLTNPVLDVTVVLSPPVALSAAMIVLLIASVTLWRRKHRVIIMP